MQKKVFWLVAGNFIVSIICACSGASKKLDSWLGNYSYTEPAIKALAGYNMVMTWDLSVNKVDKMYKAILNVTGQQTSLSMINDLTGNDSTLVILYDSTLSGANQNFKKGDTLFVLSRSANGIKTTWSGLSPMLSDHPPKQCKCFVFDGANENNNALQISR